MQPASNLRLAFDAQKQAFRARPPSYADRLDALVKLERILVGRQDDFVRAISADFGGRAREETIALEIYPVLNEIRHARRHLKLWMEPERVPAARLFWPRQARVLRHALGVVGIMAPWNYPVFLTTGPLAGALAAGNHVMLKPSELAPRTADLLCTSIAASFPPEKVAVVEGGPDVAAEFSRLPFDHLLFTGSGRVGKAVMRAAAENLTPVTLELGGKSPAIVHPSYPLERAAERIMTGKLYNAGQTCVAPDYVLVQEDRCERFVELAADAAARLYPTLVDNPDYTRIINRSQYERLESIVAGADLDGARVSTVKPENESCTAENRVFPPTLVLDPPEHSAIMKEEIFGPVLAVVRYRDLENAIRFVNDRPHPLAMYYFDDRPSRVRDVLSRTVSGGATVNDCIFHLGQPNLPFGGVGASGMGRYHGFDGFDTFSHKKGVFLQGRVSTLGLLRPPYGPAVRQLLRLIVGRPPR